MTKSDHERAASARYSGNIAAELARRRWSQSDLAIRTGMKLEAIRRRMRANPRSAAVWSARELELVAHAFGVPMETLTRRPDSAGDAES
jgi:transcriptional regulator with XRE-family HTH domain